MAREFDTGTRVRVDESGTYVGRRFRQEENGGWIESNVHVFTPAGEGETEGVDDLLRKLGLL